MALIDNEETFSSEFDAVEQQEKEAVASAPEPTKPKIPSKYEGKSLEDIVTMHQEAEKLKQEQKQSA